MADNKQNQDQKKNDRTNDAIGMPADQSNQRGNQNMETQGGNRGEQKDNMPGGSDRMDSAGDATRGEGMGSGTKQAQGGSNREAQGGSNKQMQNQSGNQGNMQEKRPSGSNEADEREEGDTRQKRPA